MEKLKYMDPDYINNKYKEITKRFERSRKELIKNLPHTTNELETLENTETDFMLHTINIIKEYNKIKNEEPLPQNKGKKRGISGIIISGGERFVDVNQRYQDAVCSILGDPRPPDPPLKKMKKTEKAALDNINSYQILICEYCSAERFIDHDESLLVCPNCAITEYYELNTIDRHPYGTEIEATPFSYKRMSHFNDWLNRFQGKEKSFVPIEILAKLNEEVKKTNDSVNTLTHEMIRKHLKRLDTEQSKLYGKGRKIKYSKYYEFSAQIVHLLGGPAPPEMSPMQEETFRTMFRQIQEPFERHKPSGRKNFLSYSYVLYKFSELKGWNRLKKCFTLLKSDNNMKVQDKVWKGICSSLDWSFHETV
jgi:hypothetical protein